MRLVLPLAALALAAAGPALANKTTDAEAAFAEDHDVQALALYNQAIAETAADAVAQATAYFGRGEVEAAEGKTEAAIADFTAALGLTQDGASRANTLFSRAEGYNRRRNFAAAVDDYAEALKLQPNMIGAHFARARALRALNRNDEAAADYDAELRLNPTSYRTLSARADLLGLPQPPDTYSARLTQRIQAAQSAAAAGKAR